MLYNMNQFRGILKALKNIGVYLAYNWVTNVKSALTAEVTRSNVYPINSKTTCFIYTKYFKQLTNDE